MKLTIKKLKTTVIMLALTAGIIFFNSALFFGLPKNTYIHGVSVGGLSKSSAVAAVRQAIIKNLKEKELKICADDKVYIFAYPEISFKDNLASLVNGIKKSGEYECEISYYLNGESAVVSGICADVNRNKIEPYALFNPSGEAFSYFEGEDGRVCNGKKLLSDVKNSLNSNFYTVNAQIEHNPRKHFLYEVKAKTKLLSRFSTQYDESNSARSNNIRLACKKINTTVLQAGKTFSFNNIVGARTVENGFSTAKIIEGGRFVEGLGGGVCQVSTTLYNAALLSGLNVTEYHPHSLLVSYVPPSRDAMVSGDYYDLKFKNSGNSPVYIRAFADNGVLTCEIYGQSDGATYSLSSNVIAEILPSEPEIVYVEGDGFTVNQRSGAESECYLTVTRNGVSSTALIRKDKYAAVRGIKGINQNLTKNG